MKELLDKLKQVDLATYKRYQGGMVYTSGEPIPCFDQELQMAWLQAVLQTAIAANGHMFSVSHIWPKESLPAYQWKARIFVDPDDIIETRGDSPSEALLAAYVEAIGQHVP
jgi:hypothetical protein